MFYSQAPNKGLGQLEAYTEEQEGVAFQMDNGMFWNSVEDDYPFPIQAVLRKTYSSKFFVTETEPGKVALRDCRGLYLAPKPIGEPQPIYPLHPTHKKPQASSEFRVFYKGNKVALQAYNGCFLTKVYRGVYVLEAAQTTLDSSCLFQPRIGELLAPDYDIINVALEDFSTARFSLCVLKKETHINRSEESVKHTFTVTWAQEVIQTTVWTHRWGLGVDTMAEFTVLDTKGTLKYNENNDPVVSVLKNISETRTEDVELPPKTKATARLMGYKRGNVAIPFKARIRKLRPGGSLQIFVEPGVWNGLVYYGLKLEVKIEPLETPCVPM